MIKAANFLIFYFIIVNLGFAQTPQSPVREPQELVWDGETLQDKQQEEAKVFIKDIIIKGIEPGDEEQLKKRLYQYQGKDLSRAEIKEIVEMVKQYYKAQEIKPQYIVSEIDKDKLFISVRYPK